jgi:hypothetical protein
MGEGSRRGEFDTLPLSRAMPCQENTDNALLYNDIWADDGGYSAEKIVIWARQMCRVPVKIAG